MEYRKRHTPGLSPPCVGIGKNLDVGIIPPTPIPVLVSAVVADDNRPIIVMVYDIPLFDLPAAPESSAFNVKVNNITVINDGSAVLGGICYIVMNADFSFGDTITVSYTKPLVNALIGLRGGEVASFIDYVVTNNILP